MRLMAEARTAIRNLRKSPGAAVAVVLTVAIGVAATSTIFTVVDALFLRPLPGVGRPSGLVNVHATAADGSSFHSLSTPAWREISKSGPFQGVAAFSSRLVSLSPAKTGTPGASPGPRLAVAQLVTGNYFSVLEARPAVGRFFGAESDAPSSEAQAVLDWGAWKERFGADPSVVGGTVLVNGRAFRIVGVAPEGFRGTFLATSFDLWIPLSSIATLLPGESYDTPDRAWLELVARRPAGLSLEAASAAMAVVAKRLQTLWPDAQRGVGFDLRRTTGSEDSLRGPATAFFSLLGLLALLVFAIACTNVTGILLARALAREKEIGIRIALGANRRGLVRLFLVETVLQFLAGGAIGVALTFWTAPLLERFELPTPFPVVFDFAPGVRVAAAGMAAAAAAGILFGLLPALVATRPDFLPLLRSGASTERRRASRLRSLFVGAQVSFSVLLLVAAGLFQQTVRHAAEANPGFAPEGLTTTQVDLTMLRYGPEEAQRAFDRLASRLRAMPGVESVTDSTLLPLGFGHRVLRAGLPGDPRERFRSIETADVGGDYFRTMKIPLLRGREFAEGDRQDAPPAAIVNETLARTLFPGADAVGHRLLREDGPIAIVGVVSDGKYRQLGEPPTPFLYLASRQAGRARRSIVIRGGGSASTLAAGIHRELAALDPAIPFSAIHSLRQFIGFSTLPQRAAGAVSGVLGILGLAVTAVGLAGLVAYSVSRRTREIGLRLAVGALPRDVLILEIRRAGAVSAIGFAAGAVGAVLLAPLLGGFLFGVGAMDPATFLGVAFLTAATTFLASFVPARRASKLDPLKALRVE